MSARRSVYKSLQITRRWLFMGVWLLVLSLVGCAGRYGGFVYDEAVDQVFEALTVLPNHRYYFSGPESRPDAVIAIDERYTLSSRLWKPVEANETQLKRWVNDPSRRARYYPYTFGRYILDDAGNRVGLWYSFHDWRQFAFVKMLDSTTVQVSTPFKEGFRRKRLFFYSDHREDD